MKILFECNDGSYVAELKKERLYAKVEEDKNMPVQYSAKASPLLNRAMFHEYRDQNKDVEKRVKDRIASDLRNVLR